MKKLLLFFAITTLLMANQCKKGGDSISADNPYGLPNATQTGANIFACRVNGQNWISKTDIYNLGANIRIDTLSFFGGGGGSPFNILSFLVKGVQQGSSYRLNDLQKMYGFVFISNSNNPCVTSTLNAYSIDGLLTITKYDLPNKIVSGTFNCIIPIPQCDTLKINEGRFDIRYN